MAWAAITYTFSPSTLAKSSEVNQNFSDVVAGLNKAMPSGGIIIWSGAIVDIPAGWVLCNGSSGSPDLRNRFVMGAGDTYAVGATGGATTHTLTVAEMPAHSHGVTDPGHTHSAYSQGGTDNSSGPHLRRDGGNDGALASLTTNTTGITIDSAGSGDAHSILNPYYALAYIMKT